MSNILEKQLLVAVSEHKITQVRELLDSDPPLDINYRSINLFENRNALEFALDKESVHVIRYTDIIEEIIKKNIIIDEIVIKKALNSLDCDHRSLKLLLGKKIINNEYINKLYNDQTLLMHAIKSRDINLVKILLENNADVNIKTSSSKTALMILLSISDSTSEDFSQNICKLLLEAEAEVNVKDKANKCVINYISKYLSYKIRLMILEKLNINPLTRAILKHDRQEINDLIKHSSSSKYINLPDSRNETAIFYCARYFYYVGIDDSQIVQSLLDSSIIDLTVKNCDNQTVLDLVLEDLGDLIEKNPNNFKNSSAGHFLKQLTKKLMDNEIYNKDLKINKILNGYFPKDLVDNIITKYSK